MVTELRLCTAFIAVLSETRSRRLRRTAPDRALGLISSRMELSRRAVKDVRAGGSRDPLSRGISAVFPFNPGRDLPNGSRSPSVAKPLLCLTFFPLSFRKMSCEITPTLPCASWRDAPFQPPSCPGLLPGLGKDAGGSHLLPLSPGSPLRPHRVFPHQKSQLPGGTPLPLPGVCGTSAERGPGATGRPPDTPGGCRDPTPRLTRNLAPGITASRRLTSRVDADTRR